MVQHKDACIIVPLNVLTRKTSKPRRLRQAQRRENQQHLFPLYELPKVGSILIYFTQLRFFVILMIYVFWWVAIVDLSKYDYAMAYGEIHGRNVQ